VKGAPPAIIRLNELAVDALLGALSEEEAAEYAALRARHPEFDAAQLERAAAILHLASGVEREPLPETLRANLAGDATDFFGEAWRTRSLETPPHRRLAPWKLYGGWVAAAACLVCASILWVTRPSRVIPVPAATLTPLTARIANQPAALANAAAPAASLSAVPDAAINAERSHSAPVAAATDARPDDPAAARARLLASGRIVLRRAWRAGGDPAGFLVSGDVVWDPATQTGYMRFVGLRRNEPNTEQYQLWIFDASRDERYPVDGGVFNISGAAQGDVIPIKAKLSVGVPLMFAVTIERPGGVVVSDRARIAALANTT
jgi:hypothetical protein